MPPNLTKKAQSQNLDLKSLSEDHCYIKPTLATCNSMLSNYQRPDEYLKRLDERLGTMESTYGPSFFAKLELELKSMQGTSFEPGFLTRVDERLGTLPQFTQPNHMKFNPPSNTQLFKMRNPDDKFLLGYKPLRGDFDIEFDNNAEDLLCLASKLNEVCHGDTYVKNKTEKEDQKLLKELQFTLVDTYNGRLKERKRRKKIVKDNGLINLQGAQLWTSRLQVNLNFFLK